MMFRPLPAPIVLAVLLVVSPASAAPSAKASGDAARGAQLFETVGCFQCHGYVGQGGVGPRLAPNPPPLAAFAAYVRSPGREMPPYSPKSLSAQELLDIHAYLASIPPPPALSDLKILPSP